MDTQNLTLTRANIKQTYVFPTGLNDHSLIIKSLDDFPDTWNFLGYGLKLEYYGSDLVCVDSRRLYIEFPSLLAQWNQSTNWYLGIKLHPWLWNDKNILELSDPITVSVSWF